MKTETTIMNVVRLAITTIFFLGALARANPASADGKALPRKSVSSPVADEQLRPGFATALAITAAGTSIGATILLESSGNEDLATAAALSLILTPSAGHLYTGDWIRGLMAVGVRSAGAALILAGLAQSERNHDGDEPDTLFSANSKTYSGLALVLLGSIYSIVDAPRSARRKNRARSSLTIVAAPVRGPGRSIGWGGQLSLRF